jgi:hypothetical protein
MFGVDRRFICIATFQAAVQMLREACLFDGIVVTMRVANFRVAASCSMGLVNSWANRFLSLAA